MRERRGGLSLVEAIIAMFILFSAFLVIIALFHSGLRHSNRVEQQQLAVFLGQRKIEEVRAWAQTTTAGGYAFDNWTPYQGVTSTPVDFPDYRIGTTASNQTVYSGCSHLEKAYPNTPGLQRKFTQSCKLLEVRVTWGQANQLLLNTLVASPPRKFRTLNPLVVTVGAYSSPLARDAAVTLTAQAYDNFGNALSDVTYSWDVGTSRAYATLVQARDGSSATLSNAVTTSSQTFYTGGNVTVQARASLHGQIAAGTSATIQLAP